MISEEIDALGDQVEFACDMSGLPVIGFTVLISDGDDGIHVEARSRAGRDVFDAILRVYLERAES